ncbi:ROK family protein [Candidatus Poriferisodalis sp.]|uniref:ROK family protein n=1 Tax=Candidatus Poriferisodalis sp. TaxID=3101277 RepID=UPI003B016024
MSGTRSADVTRLGFDVGGTKILGVATDDGGAPLRTVREPTPAGAGSLVDTLAALVRELAPVQGAVSVGVGMAGLITTAGVVTTSPNLDGVNGATIGADLSAVLGMPVAFENEVNCAARWELSSGAAQGIRHGVMVAVGTGIGGAFMVDGEVLRGANGLAGEPGHMIVEASGRLCPCGRRGCWEMYASGSALNRLAAERLGEGMRGPDVTAAARNGDAGAHEVLAEYSHWLALGISSLCVLTDPELVVISGGISEDWDLLAQPVSERLGELLIGRTAETRPAVVASEAGELSSALGAALSGAQGDGAALSDPSRMT